MGEPAELTSAERAQALELAHDIINAVAGDAELPADLKGLSITGQYLLLTIAQTLVWWSQGQPGLK